MLVFIKKSFYLYHYTHVYYILTQLSQRLMLAFMFKKCLSVHISHFSHLDFITIACPFTFTKKFHEGSYKSVNVVSLQRDLESKMATLAFDWLRHFLNLQQYNPCKVNETCQKCSIRGPEYLLLPFRVIQNNKIQDGCPIF